MHYNNIMSGGGLMPETTIVALISAGVTLIVTLITQITTVLIAKVKSNWKQNSWNINQKGII